MIHRALRSWRSVDVEMREPNTFSGVDSKIRKSLEPVAPMICKDLTRQHRKNSLRLHIDRLIDALVLLLLFIVFQI